MIRIGKPEAREPSRQSQNSSSWVAELPEAERVENGVGKWIIRNPELSIGIALAIGIGMGMLLKRR